MDEICVAKFDVYECRKSDRASALSGAQLNICAAQTPEFPDTIPTIRARRQHHERQFGSSVANRAPCPLYHIMATLERVRIKCYL